MQKQQASSGGLVWLVILGVGAWAAHRQGWLDGELVIPTPDAGPVAVAPSAELMTLVAPITQHAGAGAVAGLFRDLATVVERDNGQTITSTSVLRTYFTRAAQLNGENVGLGAKVDGVLMARLGDQPRQMDAATVAEVVSTLRAIWWACEQGG